MENKYSVFLAVLFGAFFMVLTACNEADPAPIQGQGILLRDTSSTTGSLVIQVFDQAGNGVSNADVYLFTDYEVIGRGIYLINLLSDRRGLVDFGFVNIGNYYVVAESASLGVADTSVVQVRSQKDVLKIVRLN